MDTSQYHIWVKMVYVMTSPVSLLEEWRNQLLEYFLLEVPAWNSCFVVYNENYVGLQVLQHKKERKKNPCWMDHAIKGGKLILFQRYVIIFRLE